MDKDLLAKIESNTLALLHEVKVALDGGLATNMVTVSNLATCIYELAGGADDAGAEAERLRRLLMHDRCSCIVTVSDDPSEHAIYCRYRTKMEELK